MTDTRLLWTGTDETNRFHDEERGRIYYASERPLRVPADAYEEYLDQDGWEEPPDEEGQDRFPSDDNESVRDARAREEQEHGQENEQQDGGTDEIRAEPATEATDADLAESDGDAADTAADTEDFDAEAFVDNDWREVEQQIQSGEYDEFLGEIEHAERNRDGQPREASVLGAIKDRRNAPLSNASTEDADSDSDADG